MDPTPTEPSIISQALAYMTVFKRITNAEVFLLMVYIVIIYIVFNLWNRNMSNSWHNQISSKTEDLLSRQVHEAASNHTAGVTSSRWVVISLAVFSNMSRGYEFCLPLAVAAWKRIGWHSLILIVQNSNIWHTANLLKLVREETLLVDPTAKFVFVNVTRNPVSYAQVSRLFAAVFTPYFRFHDILMTTDIDIIPIKGEIYDEVKKHNISLLNTNSKRVLKWNNTIFVMQPMAYIAMNVGNWKKVMDFRPLKSNETHANYINSWLRSHYGKTISDTDVIKGGNEAWFLDQRIISIQLNKSNLEKYKRLHNPVIERVDRARFWSWKHFRRYMDAHVYYRTYREETWNRTFRLIKDIFSSDIVNSLKLYRETYVKILLNRTDN